jgi:hypothetical protein
LPRSGAWETTRPFATVDVTVRSFPTEQNRLLIASFAAFSVLPTTFGTRHGRRANLAPTLTLSAIAMAHFAVPVQAPDQCKNRELLAGFAFSVKDVP